MLVDTSFTYSKNGELLSMTTFSGDFSKRFTTSYREDGTVSYTISNFKSDTSRFTYDVKTQFSDSGCITGKTLGKMNQNENYHYTCKVHAKISVRKAFYYDTIEVTHRIYIPEVEGRGKEIITVKRELSQILKVIPYTIEIGEFEHQNFFDQRYY